MSIIRNTRKQRELDTAQLKQYKKINFGSGHDYRNGYLNVDVDEACNPDLLIKNNDYSVIPRDSYTEIIANDVLEHIPRSQTLSILLDWSNYLKPKGKLHIQTSSILGVAEQLKKNKNFPEQYGWTICLFGNQAHPGDFHHTGFTEATLKVNILAAGYAIDSFELKDKWLFHVDCHKVSDWKKVIQKTVDKDDEYFTKALFKDAFDREPDAAGGQYILDALRTKTLNREEAAKHLYASPERLYFTAQKYEL